MEANKILWIIKINLFQSINYAGNRTAVADVCLCAEIQDIYLLIFFFSLTFLFLLLSPQQYFAFCVLIHLLLLLLAVDSNVWTWNIYNLFNFKWDSIKEEFVSLYVDDSLSHVQAKNVYKHTWGWVCGMEEMKASWICVSIEITGAIWWRKKKT